ncbi:three component ABC system middle component [Pseudactinotalea sp. Z1739]|uniref:three component ABC system middle component n=1 Tax=Pseudactinotalea sp. Z1739 TaxID=3413028 RepID=UPI003C7A1CF1
MSNDTIQSALDSETSVLFNPAFCAVLLHKVCAGYAEKAGAPMPVVYAFLILPNALHKPTRDALPKTTAASMWPWLREHPVLLMDLPDRVRRLRPYTAAAIAYGLGHTILIGALGTLSAGTIGRRPPTLKPTEDWLSCQKAAGFLGKWFAGTDADEATTLAQWGVRP